MGPDTFSVHGESTRTNNAVESHNSRLGDMMGVSGNPLVFTKKLRVVARAKANSMGHAIDGSQVEKRVKVENASLANLISSLDRRLKSGMTAEQNLHIVTSRLADKTFELNMFAEADEMQPVEEVHAAVNVLNCRVCQETRASRLAMPCGHIILCLFCVEPAICTWEGCGRAVSGNWVNTT